MPAPFPRHPTIASAGAAIVLCGALLVAAAGVGPAAAQEPAAHPAREVPEAHARPVQHPAHPLAHIVLHHPATAAHARHPVLHPASHSARTPHHASPVPVAVPVPVPVPPAPALPLVPPKGSNTGLPLPRFASLRADVVNMRSGPGTRYPIQWVYKRRDLPVKIEREFDVWRLVEDSDGVKGWVHQATLVGTRSFVILGNSSAPDSLAPGSSAPGSSTPGSSAIEQAPDAAGASDPPPGSHMLRATPQPDGAVVAILKPGVIGRIRSCPPGSGWCRVSIRDYSGWLPRNAFWGLLSDETILPP